MNPIDYEPVNTWPMSADELEAWLPEDDDEYERWGDDEYDYLSD